MPILDAHSDDVAWLLGPETAPIIEAAGRETNALQALATLRKSLSATRAALIVEQAELRRKARDKFSSPERMFFTPHGLEQSTDEAIAAYKAQRFGEGKSVVDLCAGIGGDLMAIAGRGPAFGVERHAVTAQLAQANAGTRVQAADADSIAVEDFEYWHIDPDRRPHDKRSTRVEQFDPAPERITQWLRVNPNGAIKVAPASDVPDQWKQAAEREWITSRRECRQQVLWFGVLATDAGRHRATVVTRHQPPATIVGTPDLPVESAARVGRYIFVPDSAVIVSRLVGQLARQFEIASIDGQTAWLTADRLGENALLSAFEVCEVLPFDRRRVRAWLRQRRIGRVEIKTRSVNMNVEQLVRELTAAGEGEMTLLVTPLFGRITAVFARRIENVSGPIMT